MSTIQIARPEASTSADSTYQICTKTVMDTSDPNITFDQDGVSNHVHEYRKAAAQHVLTGDVGDAALNSTFERIRKHGQKSTYDCIVGLSGGVDSTYLCLLAKQHGLRPLVVHFDNGWNSELAVHNIENTVRKLDFDLYTYVVDWPEFRDLQRAYFKANVIDIEVLTDHGFMSVLYDQARKHGIKYVLGGMNVVTEGILPTNWIYSKADTINIKAIHQAFGEIPTSNLRSYPFLTPLRRKIAQQLTGLEVVSPLNWVEFTYDEIKSQIATDLEWRDYGGKHYESVFTRFYQGHILPEKFGIDKRRAHLSTLICSGQMTRDQAMARMAEPGYPQEQFDIDKPFVMKKLGFTADEFDDYMAAPRVEHREYPYWQSVFQKHAWLRDMRDAVRRLRRAG